MRRITVDTITWRKRNEKAGKIYKYIHTHTYILNMIRYISVPVRFSKFVCTLEKYIADGVVIVVLESDEKLLVWLVQTIVGPSRRLHP